MRHFRIGAILCASAAGATVGQSVVDAWLLDRWQIIVSGLAIAGPFVAWAYLLWLVNSVRWVGGAEEQAETPAAESKPADWSDEEGMKAEEETVAVS